MPEQEPMTQTTSITDAARDFSNLVKKVSEQEARILVEQNGQPVAALVSPEDLNQLKRIDAYRRDPWRVVDEIHARNRDSDPSEVERDVAEVLAEVRAEERMRRGRGASK
jgi:prevent-host-death family protein